MQDPNCRAWQPMINQEAHNIAAQLMTNNIGAAGAELNQDLFNMRGDLYAQNQLLSQINAMDQNGSGGRLYLGDYN